MRLQESRKKACMAALAVLVLLLAVLTLVFCVIHFKKKTDTTSPYDQRVAEFIEENSKFDSGQIVFIGDSITAKYKLHRHYRDLSHKTYNRGISGDTTDWMLARMQASLFDISPSKVVLMIGTNDINGPKSAEQIAENYENILSLISSHLPNTEVYCISIIPQNREFSENAHENNQKIIETNEKIDRLAKMHGYEFINLYDALVDETGLLETKYSNDGLHLNRKGYKVFTNTVQDYLKE